MTAPRQFRHALVLGKFYPLHSGHDHLIRSAVRAADSVTVEVIGSSVESIPVATRADWVRAVHPTVRVASAVDDTPVDFDSPILWDAHMRTITGLLDAPVDAVFSSDEYGAELARRLDATWVQIDPGRRVNPVSGTAVRADLAGHWAELAAPVRATLAPRVVVVGAESTGTTTLAQAMAERRGTVWVPEYGREYTIIRPGGPTAPWRSDEFDLIVDRQLHAEHEAAHRAPIPLVICDTDVAATALWHERYVGTRSPTVEAAAAAHRPALYLLTGDEIAFVQDGLRDGEHIQHDMQQRFREFLAAGTTPWLEVRGSVAERVAAADRMIDVVLEDALRFELPLEQRESRSGGMRHGTRARRR
ncbi:AAA family ATPase [Gordonia sp. CPCC 205515]|uniref:AAA family ATPase n=1 Tax=Gordonia sp. CPCC 205515 TaxID=3140791 RepID=UPI003AF36E03